MERPDVDKINGLSPVISIEQKTVNKNPRSTVGTITEIYDFLRLLYARAANAYSYETGELMVKMTEEQIRQELDLIIQNNGQAKVVNRKIEKFPKRFWDYLLYKAEIELEKNESYGLSMVHPLIYFAKSKK
jgi:excinuclease UvrABC ATPase subunit